MTTVVRFSKEISKLDRQSVYFYSIVQQNICQAQYFLKKDFEGEKKGSESKIKFENQNHEKYSELFGVNLKFDFGKQKSESQIKI